MFSHCSVAMASGASEFQERDSANMTRPPYSGDLELLCDPEYRSYHVDERVDTHKKKAVPDTSASAAKKTGTKNVADDGRAPNLFAMCKNLDTKLAKAPAKSGNISRHPDTTSATQSLNASDPSSAPSAELHRGAAKC